MSFKFISPGLHGIIDWLTVGMLPAIPRLMGYDCKMTRLHDMVAGGIAASSAFTDYPAGLVKIMPMQTHLALDKMNGAMFLAAAAIMDDEPSGARACVASTGLFLLLNGFCTRSQSQEQAPRRGSFARNEPIQRYAEETRPDIYGSNAGADSGAQAMSRR